MHHSRGPATSSSIACTLGSLLLISSTIRHTEAGVHRPPRNVAASASPAADASTHCRASDGGIGAGVYRIPSKSPAFSDHICVWWKPKMESTRMSSGPRGTNSPLRCHPLWSHTLLAATGRRPSRPQSAGADRCLHSPRILCPWGELDGRWLFLLRRGGALLQMGPREVDRGAARTARLDVSVWQHKGSGEAPRPSELRAAHSTWPRAPPPGRCNARRRQTLGHRGRSATHQAGSAPRPRRRPSPSRRSARWPAPHRAAAASAARAAGAGSAADEGPAPAEPAPLRHSAGPTCPGSAASSAPRLGTAPR